MLCTRSTRACVFLCFFFSLLAFRVAGLIYIYFLDVKSVICYSVKEGLLKID